MAFSLSQLSALEAAIATGQLRVEYDGKRVEYRSFDDLRNAYNFIRGQLIAAGQLTEPQGANRGPASVAVFSRD